MSKKIKLSKSAQRKIAFEVADVIEYWSKLAQADVNEIMQYRRVCCRYCYGKNHAYQWVEQMYALAVEKAEKNDLPMPDASGGFGFNGTKRPNKKCPVCFGEGEGRAFFNDTRKLSENARLLYAGVKLSKGGLELLTKNQEKAVENLAKVLGMFKISFEIDDKREKELTSVSSVTLDETLAAQLYLEQIAGE